MYSIKIGRDGEAFEVYPCGHYTVTYIQEESVAVKQRGELPGVRLDLSDPHRTLRLPQDGSVVYVMNTRGDTVETYRYPPRERQKEVA